MENLSFQLHELFSNGRHSEVIKLCTSQSINSLSSPAEAKILAASYFCLGEFSDAYNLLVDLDSTFGHTSDFLSLYAASARRVGKTHDAELLFKRALQISPDAPNVLNNYANLLIDLEKFDDALKILDDVLRKNPEYADAISNKNRLMSLISGREMLSSGNSLPTSIPDNFLSDPLLLSFAQEEIDFSDGRYFPNKKDLGFQGLSQAPVTEVASEQLQFAEKAIENGNPEMALQLCSKALNSLGQDARIYDILSDTYLNLKNLDQSEICLLQAISIGGMSLKRCLNLANFSMIRGNLGLAEFYLSKAASIDPSSEYVEKMQQKLSYKVKNKKGAFSFKNSFDIINSEKTTKSL